MNIVTGMISPEMNWAPKLALVQLLVLGVEDRLYLALAAEHLDEGVAAERLLDLAVEPAGVRPLSDELALRTLGDLAGHHHHDGDRHEGDEGEQRRDPNHHGDRRR